MLVDVLPVILTITGKLFASPVKVHTGPLVKVACKLIVHPPVVCCVEKVTIPVVPFPTIEPY